MHRLLSIATGLLILSTSTCTVLSPAISVSLPTAMSFVTIPAGSFVMGSPENEPGRAIDEGPQYSVYLETYEMMTTEVTQAMWEEVTGTTIHDLNEGSYYYYYPGLQGEGADYPVYLVSWHDCRNFAARMNELDPEYIYSLPTEAQWEYACRAGTTARFFWGEDPDQVEIDSYAWFSGNSENHVYPVGTKSPNPWGLYDMCGNVWEWCEDIYAGSYHSHLQDGSAFDGLGVRGLVRGGGQNSRPSDCRSARRLKQNLVSTYMTGFRLVRVAQEHSSTHHPWYKDLIRRFEMGTEGVITDLETDLQWLVGSERQTSLTEAEVWVESLGNGWRMPTRSELYFLYEAGIGFGNWDVFENAGDRVWSLDEREYPSDWCCVFQSDNEYWFYIPDDDLRQSFAVRAISASPVSNDTPSETTVTLPAGMEFTEIPEGSFVMGSSESEQGRSDTEDPQHTVHIDSFEFMTTPVTQGMWDEVIGGIPNFGRGVGYNFPVYDIGPGSIQVFIEIMNELDTAHNYRLPSEAEWEYACRAGTITRFYWGDDPDNTEIDLYAWYQGNSTTRTHPVGQKLPNNWGLYDMSGNVMEFCRGSLIPDDGNPVFALRGGTFTYGPDGCRSAYRPIHADRSNGFRLVRTMVNREAETFPVEYNFHKDSEGIITDLSSGLEWSVHPAHSVPREDARGWAYSLGEGWRIPTPQELRDLYETNTAFYGYLGTEWGVWSEDEFDSASISCICMSDGEEFPSSFMYLPFEVRAFAVRTYDDERLPPVFDASASMQDPSEVRFIKDSYGNITDTQTGLVWCVGPARDCDMVDASRFLVELGDGWRFPSISELETLHEAGIYWPGNMGPFEIRGLFNKGFWIWSDDQVDHSYRRRQFLFGFTIFGCRDHRSFQSGTEFVRVFAVRSSSEDAVSIATPDEINHELRFNIDSDKIITDRETGLRWLVGPDTYTSWAEAQNWLNAIGGGWRFPNPPELESLYEAGVTTVNWGPFINNGLYVWCEDLPAGGYSASGTNSWKFTFYNGGRDYNNLEGRETFRVFAISD